jgi:pilus assembly protein Flp/PilA
MYSVAKNYIGEESGATSMEYGLIASLISVGIIAGAQIFGVSLIDAFQAISDSVAASR